MKNIGKNAFTLVELLSVIAIISILLIIAVPNVLKQLRNAKQSSFELEVQEVYSEVEKQVVNDAITSGTNGNNKIYSTGDLDISGGEDLEYSIAVNNQGQITCYEIKNDEYMWIFRGSKDEYLEDISDLDKIKQVTEIDKDYIIDCSNFTADYDTSVAGTLAESDSWWRGATDESKIEWIIFTNKYNSTNYQEAFFSDEENVGGLKTYVENNIAYVVINRNRRNKSAFKLSKDASKTFSNFTNLKYILGLKLMDLSDVENMDYFFGNTSITKKHLTYANGYEEWNTSNVKSAKYMFANIALPSYNLGSWDTSNLEDATGMFMNTSATRIDLSSWNTSKITNFSNMFSGSKATMILLNKWNTNADATYNNMFNNNTNLTSIIASDDFKVNNKKIVMFDNDEKLMGSNGTTYNTNKSEYARLDKDGQKGYLSDKIPNGILTAKLYDSGTVSGNYTELTTSGATISPWNYYSGSKLLEIKIYSMNIGETKTLEISVPAGMYIVSDSWTKSSNEIKSVSFNTLLNQGTGTYKNSQTGTLKYILNSDAVNATIKCQVMFDKAIWDKNNYTYNTKNSSTTNMTNSSPIVVNFNNGSSIKKISNIKSAVSVGESTTGSGYNFYVNNYNTNIYIGNETTLIKNNYLLSTDQTSMPFYYKSVEYKSEAYVMQGSKKINATIVDKPYTSTHNMKNPDSVSNSNGVYISKWSNVYTSSNTQFPRLTYLLEEGKGIKIGDKLTIVLTVKLTTMSGQVDTIKRTLTYDVKSKELNLSNLKYGSSGRYAPEESYYENSEYTDVLGNFTLYNDGYEDINNVKFTFDYDSKTSVGTNPKMKVYASRIFAQNGQTVVPEITLIDDNGKTYGPYKNSFKCTSSSMGIFISANNIAKLNSLSGTYYLKKIVYSLPIISGTKNIANGEKNYLYQNQGSGSQTSGGIIIGRINAQAESKLTIEFVGTGTKYERTLTSNVTKNPSYSGYISRIDTPSGTNIVAGNKFGLNVRVEAVSYPYTNTQAFSKPELYVILPYGINIENAIITSDASKIESESQAIIKVLKSQIIDGVINNVYKISFSDKTWFGYLKVNDSYASSGTYYGKWIKLTMSTDDSMEFTNINLRDNIYFKDENGHISISGSYAKYSITDKYDVDNDGSTTDKFGTIIETDKVISISENNN